MLTLTDSAVTAIRALISQPEQPARRRAAHHGPGRGRPALPAGAGGDAASRRRPGDRGQRRTGVPGRTTPPRCWPTSRSTPRSTPRARSRSASQSHASCQAGPAGRPMAAASGGLPQGERCPARRRCTWWPPPGAARRLSSCSRVVVIRAPEQPSGWPIAMAPPLTFTRSGSSLQLVGHRHRLRRERLVDLDQVEPLPPASPPGRAPCPSPGPARSPCSRGARPPRRCPHSGPSASAPAAPVSARSEASSRHAAPSLSGEELPPVTVPPARNAGPLRGQLVHGQAGPDALVAPSARPPRC